MNTLQLQHPITVNGVEITEIALRRPKVRDLETMDKAKGGEIAKSVEFMAHLAEWPPAQVRELDAADFQAASKVIEGFLGNG